MGDHFLFRLFSLAPAVRCGAASYSASGELALVVHQLQNPVAPLQVLLGVSVGVIGGGVFGMGNAGALRGRRFANSSTLK